MCKLTQELNYGHFVSGAACVGVCATARRSKVEGTFSFLFQAIVTFEDVAISFLEDEWNESKEWQKELYKDVTRENYQALISLVTWMLRESESKDMRVPGCSWASRRARWRCRCFCRTLP
uniref:KRAB domain-containing protein n=1 Tax=Apteryx owenii TaxID=8824 RepID=A0A8B9NTF2_APTOW